MAPMRPLDPHMTVRELLGLHPGLARFFLRHSMLCPGCPAEAFHTLGEVARIHGRTWQDLKSALEETLRTCPTQPEEDAG